MKLENLKRHCVNYYDVDGMKMTHRMINTLLLCYELEKNGICYSAMDFRIIDLAKHSLIDTSVNTDRKVITYLTTRGRKKAEWLFSKGITRL